MYADIRDGKETVLLQDRHRGATCCELSACTAYNCLPSHAKQAPTRSMGPICVPLAWHAPRKQQQAGATHPKPAKLQAVWCKLHHNKETLPFSCHAGLPTALPSAHIAGFSCPACLMPVRHQQQQHQHAEASGSSMGCCKPTETVPPPAAAAEASMLPMLESSQGTPRARDDQTRTIPEGGAWALPRTYPTALPVHQQAAHTGKVPAPDAPNVTSTSSC